MIIELLDSTWVLSGLHASGYLANLLGWLGTFSYLVAYLLLVLGVLKSKDKLYHLLNIAGAAGLILHSFKMMDWPNIIVNLVWAIIALTALVLLIRKKKLIR